MTEAVTELIRDEQLMQPYADVAVEAVAYKVISSTATGRHLGLSLRELEASSSVFTMPQNAIAVVMRL